MHIYLNQTVIGEYSHELVQLLGLQTHSPHEIIVFEAAATKRQADENEGTK
jgi:hypothetical protein